jgi:hypothetical protein
MKRFKKGLKKGAAVVGLVFVSAVSVAPVYAGTFWDSAAKDEIDHASADAKEIGLATIVLSAAMWGMKKVRNI